MIVKGFFSSSLHKKRVVGTHLYRFGHRFCFYGEIWTIIFFFCLFKLFFSFGRSWNGTLYHGTSASMVSFCFAVKMSQQNDMRPSKTQISLGIRPVWSESSLCTQWIAKDLSFLHADSKDSDQTGQMPRLIWVFAGHTCHFVGFVMLQLNSENNRTSKTVQCCNYPRICTMWFYHKVMCPKDADRMANSLDPVQTSSDLGLLSLHIPFCQNLRTIYSYCSHLKIVLFLLMTVIILKIKAYCSEEQIRRVFHDNLEIIFVISP